MYFLHTLSSIVCRCFGDGCSDWCYLDSLGFCGGSDGKESACSVGDLASIPGLGRSPGEEKWQSTPVFLPRESHGQRNQAGYSQWDHKELDTAE